MKEKSLTKTRDVWLDHHRSDNALAVRSQALLCQLCGKEAKWDYHRGYSCCRISCDNADKAGRSFTKFMQMLYIQGIIEGGFMAGAYIRNPHCFEVRMSEPQLRQMREYHSALMRSQNRRKSA